MPWIDVTLPIDEQHPSWPGDPPFVHHITAILGEKGCNYNLSRMDISTHFGTHVDAPFHFVADGKTVDELDADLLVGPCVVVEALSAVRLVMPSDIDGQVPNGTKRVLIKTINSERYLHDGRFHEEFVALSPESVQLLLSRGVRLIGIDYYSIAPYDNPTLVHTLFLGHGCTVALEAVDLSRVSAGEYDMICLPMKVRGASGAPARVLLRPASTQCS